MDLSNVEYLDDKQENLQHLNEIEGFLRQYAMSDTTFGHLARHDTNYVKQLRGGRQSRRKTIRDNRAWMVHYRATHT
jgi:hypothetical protein